MHPKGSSSNASEPVKRDLNRRRRFGEIYPGRTGLLRSHALFRGGASRGHSCGRLTRSHMLTGITIGHSHETAREATLVADPASNPAWILIEHIGRRNLITPRA